MRGNHTSQMKLYLDNGINVNATNNRGQTAVYLVTKLYLNKNSCQQFLERI